MPMRRFVLMLAAVLAAAGLTVWVAMRAMPQIALPMSGSMAVLLLVLAYLGWRAFTAWRGRSGR